MEYLGKEDSHPSFSVNVDSGLFGCFSCGFKGQFPDLVAYVLDIERADAVAWIRSKGTLARVDRLLAKKPAPVDTTELVNEASLALFEPPPLWALADRGLTAAACEQYGVLWEPEEELWITPVRDEYGVLLGWQMKNERYFENYPVGLKKSKHVFGLQTLPKRCLQVTVVESPLDAVLIASAGWGFAVSTYGASISDKQMQLISERCDNVLLCLDNDVAGRKSRDDVIERWGRRGIGLLTVDYRCLLPGREDIEGLDPGDLSDAELLTLLIESPIPASIAAITLRDFTISRRKFAKRRMS
jgi:hypothetical protein